MTMPAPKRAQQEENDMERRAFLQAATPANKERQRVAYDRNKLADAINEIQAGGT